MQPQGHVQIVVNLIDFGMNVQEAGDAPRVQHDGSCEPTGERMTDGGEIVPRVGDSADEVEALEARGHKVVATSATSAATRRSCGTPRVSTSGPQNRERMAPRRVISPATRSQNLPARNGYSPELASVVWSARALFTDCESPAPNQGGASPSAPTLPRYWIAGIPRNIESAGVPNSEAFGRRVVGSSVPECSASIFACVAFAAATSSG